MSCLCSLVFNLNYKAIITAEDPGCQQWNPGLICSESIKPSSALEDLSPLFFQSGHLDSPLSHFHNYACPVTGGVKTLYVSKLHLTNLECFIVTTFDLEHVPLLLLSQYICCFWVFFFFPLWWENKFTLFQLVIKTSQGYLRDSAWFKFHIRTGFMVSLGLGGQSWWLGSGTGGCLDSHCH